MKKFILLILGLFSILCAHAQQPFTLKISEMIAIFFNQIPLKLRNGIGLLLLVGFTLPVYGQQFINPRFSRYTIDNGLSRNTIYAIVQDKQGFMWIGTTNGLDRYDGYEFKIFHHNDFDTTSLSNDIITTLFSDSRGLLWVGTINGLDLYNPEKNHFKHYLANRSIKDITEDKKGNLWIATSEKGLYKLPFDTTDRLSPDKFTHYTQSSITGGLNSNFISGILCDENDKLWILYNSSNMQYADLSQNDIRFYDLDLPILKASKTAIANGFKYDLKNARVIKGDITISSGKDKKGKLLFEDNLHRIWIGSVNGLFLLNLKQKNIIYFNTKTQDNGQSMIASVCQGGKKNLLWLGLFNGLGVFNTKTFNLYLYKNEPENNKSLLPGRMLSIYKDQSGCIWLGSNGFGLCKYNIRSSLFTVPEYHTSDDGVKLNMLSVHSFFETDKYLFIGATDGLWLVSKKTGLMQRVNLNDLAKKNSNQIYSIIPADSNAVWLSSNIGFIWYRPSDHSVKLFLPAISGQGKTDNRIFKLYKANNKNIWCLTPYSFSLFNTVNKKFTHYFYNHNLINPDSEPTYGDIYQDKKGNFWLGTGQGLLYFDTLRKTFQHYTTRPDNDSSLSADLVRCITPDPTQPDKYLWIGTAGGGLNKFNLQTKKFSRITKKNGLPDNTIYGILTDKHNNLWLSTNKGIIKFNPRKDIVYHYEVDEGLQNNKFNSNAYYKNKNGKLFFGGIRGFNAFYPDSIKDNPHPPRIAFTDFRLFNKSVKLNDGSALLHKIISQTHKIVLPYKDNIISFQVAALDYSDPDKNQYAYRLKNFSNSWINLGSNRLITFSNLNPGHYVLDVKAANSEGVWNEKEASLNLIIMPPWWKTWWAYLIYFLILAAIFYFIRRYELKRIRLRNRLRLEHLESQKLKELDHLKSRFFANISHEFRTPLTLIIGPLEDMMHGGDPEKFTALVPEMHRNSKRLLQLINQLLDLSRLDSGNYHINTTREDIIPFVRQIVHSFSSLAERKNISLETEVDSALRNALNNEKTRFYFDEDIIEKVLANLLSNAFKFTPGGGEIFVSLGLHENKETFLELKVEDNGAGILSGKLPYIFDRFYQADNSIKRQHEGSGIGLSLVKELIELHQGKISVTSELHKGSVFTCLFPLNEKIAPRQGETKKSAPVIPEIPLVEAEKDGGENDFNQLAEDKPLILVVEDHRDVRKYIVEKLKNNYTTIEAKNGKAGLEAAFKEIPDLVVSDVMMPEMDGFELCKQLKTNDLTSHIPVILLTARAEDSDKMAGLETGADAYLIKPFNSQELRIRVKNLIEVRNKMRTKFSNKLIVKPSEITVTSIDQQFMQKLLSTVEDHVSDPQFSVDQLAGQMNMSGSQIYRKLKALIDQSAQQFIQSIRMQRALELLKNGSGTVSEISWKVGFENPGYFSKVFKNHFGCLPSEKEKFPA